MSVYARVCESVMFASFFNDFIFSLYEHANCSTIISLQFTGYGPGQSIVDVTINIRIHTHSHIYLLQENCTKIDEK